VPIACGWRIGDGGAEALVFRDERLDYAGLKARVDEFARALLAVGIRRGDRVALLVTNRTEWIVAAFAAAKIGAVVAAISTFSTPRELASALEHSGAAALVTLNAFRGRRFLDALHDLCPELDRSALGALRSARLPSLHTVVAVAGHAPAGVFSLPDRRFARDRAGRMGIDLHAAGKRPGTCASERQSR